MASEKTTTANKTCSYCPVVQMRAASLAVTRLSVEGELVIALPGRASPRTSMDLDYHPHRHKHDEQEDAQHAKQVRGFSIRRGYIRLGASASGRKDGPKPGWRRCRGQVYFSLPNVEADDVGLTSQTTVIRACSPYDVPGAWEKFSGALRFYYSTATRWRRFFWKPAAEGTRAGGCRRRAALQPLTAAAGTARLPKEGFPTSLGKLYAFRCAYTFILRTAATASPTSAASRWLMSRWHGSRRLRRSLNCIRTATSTLTIGESGS
jgi:hypothetical protein